MLQYSQDANNLMVTPDRVEKGSRIYFQSSEGKVRVVFLSPFGEENTVLQDSEIAQVTVGGIYHFNAYMISPGSTAEFAIPTPGVIDVIPHR